MKSRLQQADVPSAHSGRTRIRRRSETAFRRMLYVGTILLVWLLAAGNLPGEVAQKRSEAPLMLVVMDPLAKELACACVKGYGQRDYRKLAARLETAAGQRVAIEFSDDLAESMAGVDPAQEVIVIGEQALVADGAKQAGLKCRPVCELTGRDGVTTSTASFLARSDDPAKEMKDVGGRRVFIGIAETGGLYAGALAAMRTAGVESSVMLERRGSYTDAALDLLDSQLSPPPVAVIPSYALPLLEGCGSVKPGALKVIGKTEPAPFIAVFFSDRIPAEKQKRILQALVGVKSDAALLEAMETRDGFLPIKSKETGGPKASANPDWPDWRGRGRAAHVPRLPARLPASPKIVWKKAAMEGCLAGLSISGERLILAERDFAEEHDVYRCLNADSGELLWLARFSARGKMDYGQSPRATPVIHAGKAYLLGAFGGLRCVDLADGKVLWERDLPRQFEAQLPTWGMCSPPLIVDDLLVVNPGSTNASLAALDCVTGSTRWTTPGLPAAYSAFVCGDFGGRRQIVGYDQQSLGGWDIKTGARLWQLSPAVEGDFNVPTPVAVDGGVLVSTENNGTRLYRFDDTGRIIPKPSAEFADLSPSTASPVITCGRAFGAHSGLYCLDLRQGLKPVWYHDEETLGDHAALIADTERVLIMTLGGELILLDAKANHCVILSRLRVFPDDVEVYSHPALVGTKFYARGGTSVVCVDLGTD